MLQLYGNNFTQEDALFWHLQTQQTNLSKTINALSGLLWLKSLIAKLALGSCNSYKI